MENEILGLIEFALDPKHSDEGENYLSDGEILDIVLARLKRICVENTFDQQTRVEEGLDHKGN